MPTAASPRSALALLPIFALSGAASLIFENLWQRKMIFVFGASAASTTAILTSFFFGMALGSLLGGHLLARLQHRVPTLQLYAACELWIGLSGAAVPALLRGVDALYLGAFAAQDPSAAFSVAYRFAMCCVVVLPASLGMGATIPIMSRLLAEHGGGVGRSVSLAYGANTLGAVSGCLASTFLLLPAFGIQGSLWIASGLNAAIVALALWLARGAAPLPLEPGAAVAWPPRAAWLLALYALAGFLAIGFEVTWLRMLAIFDPNGLSSFTLALAIYLSGFALGSLLLFRWLESRLSGLAIFAVSNFGLAATALATLWRAQEIQLWIWSQVEPRLLAGGSPTFWSLCFEVAANLSLLLLPTIFMGLAFPALCQAWSEQREQIAPTSGSIYFVGNLGSTAGAFATGLFLVPTLGLDGSWGLLVAGAAALALGTLALAPLRRRALLASACIAVAALAIAATRENRAYVHPGGQRPLTLLRHQTGASASVSVREQNPGSGNGNRMLYIDDQVVASTHRFGRVDSKMLAHLPLLLHPDPKLALTVGFGTGGTSWSMLTHAVRTHVVEIEPEVIRSAQLFEMQNHGVLRSELLQVVLNDARNHLYTTRERYDVISTDVTNLRYKQNASLYTRDYFEILKSRLTPDGIACAWIPLSVEDWELRSLMATWAAVFPHASFWYFDQTQTGFAILIGTPGPLRLDYARLARGFARPAVRADLAEIDIHHPLHLAHFLYLDERAFRDYAGDAAIHSDDHPVLELGYYLNFSRPEPDQRERFARLEALRPQSIAPWLLNLPDAEQPELERYARFARAWGAFVNHHHWDPQGLRGTRAFGERARGFLEAAVAAAPEYEPARRRLEALRRKLAPRPQADGLKAPQAAS